MANSKSKTKVDASAPVDEKKVEPEVREKLKPIEIDPHQYVVVRNGFQGKLIYISKRTGEKFVWESFGDEQEIELQELKNAKNSSKKFFINNWFLFNEDWVIDYLGVKQFYRYALNVDDFDSIFLKTPDEIEKAVAKLSNGQKRSVAYRARTLIADGSIDSNRVIKALEKALGIDLVEK